MGEKRKIYSALVDGATEGLSDVGLLNYVVERCPDASSRKILQASLLTLEDPNLLDRNVLNTVLAFAVKVRLKDFEHLMPALREACAPLSEAVATSP